MEENIATGFKHSDENDQNTEIPEKRTNISQESHKTNIIVKDETSKKELFKSISLESQNEVKEIIDEDQQKTIGDQENKINVKVTPEDELEKIHHAVEAPQDLAAPYNLTDSSEALKTQFELRPDQLIELEDLWNLFQNYTPAYTDIDGYITEKELVYLLKSLFLMPYTLEQLQELIAFCVRPAHPEGHIYFDQFVKIATIRYRDISIENNLRSALQVLDQGEGLMSRDNMREVLTTMGHKMPVKQINLLIKEVDIRNDGLISIEDVMATICIDLIFD